MRGHRIGARADYAHHLADKPMPNIFVISQRVWEPPENGIVFRYLSSINCDVVSLSIAAFIGGEGAPVAIIFRIANPGEPAWYKDFPITLKRGGTVFKLEEPLPVGAIATVTLELPEGTKVNDISVGLTCKTFEVV